MRVIIRSCAVVLVGILANAGCLADGDDDYEEPVLDGKSDAVTAKVAIHGEIGFGDAVTGTFDTSKLHGYTFRGAKGASVSIQLTGDVAQHTDTVVMLYGPHSNGGWGGARIAKDDDGAGNKFSRLSFVLPDDGEYLIVATMKGRSYAGKTYELALSCESERCTTVAPGAARWTALVYGSFDTHDAGGIPSSLQDMAQRLSADNDAIQLLYLEDPPEGPNTKLWKVGMRSVELVKDYGELHLGKPQTLTDVLQFVHASYPSERFFLSVVGHTSSAVAAFLPDYFPVESAWEDQRMMYWQLRQAILDSGVPIDVLALSGCGTGELEIITRFADTAKFIIGLQEYSFGYTDVRWADSLVRNPTLDARGLARRVAEGMFKKSYYDQNQPGATGAYDTAQIAAVKVAFAALAATLNDKATSNRAELVAARKTALQMSSGGFEFMIDATDFANQLAVTSSDPDIVAAAGAFSTALDALVVGAYADPDVHGNAHGINLTFMRKGYGVRISDPADFDEASAWPAAETSFYEASGWRQFVTTIYPYVD